MNDLLKHLLQLKDPQEIEEIAQHLSLEDLQTLLKLIEYAEDEFKERIIPIFAGMQPAHFALLSSSPLFEKHVKNPILQRKIQSLIEHFQKILDQYTSEKKTLDECINDLPLFPVNALLLSSLCEQVVQLSDKIGIVIQLLDHLLKLTWLSENTALIDAFSNFKNSFSLLGAKESDQPVLLMQRLNSIFAEGNESSSLEGLAALGIQYKEDFQRLGVSLGEDLSGLADKSLVTVIHDRLNAAGLATIKDLKQHKIYTKEHLFAYLKKPH